MKNIAVRKPFGVFAVAACLSLGVADEAKAGGPFCLTFPNFCDSITIRTVPAAGRTWIVGNWDWTCAGDLIPVIGVTGGFAFGTRFDGDSAVMFKVSQPLFDLAGTSDGVNLFVFQDDQAITISAGVCPGHPINAGSPRLLESR